MSDRPLTDRDRVLAVLREDRPRYVPGEALARRSGTMRFGARIFELRNQGFIIKKSRMMTTLSGKAVFGYLLMFDPELDVRPTLFTDDPAPQTGTYRDVA